MNANELADDAKNISNTIEALEWVQKVVPMLRQQQSEIEALKNKHEFVSGYAQQGDIMINELRKELALQRLSDIGQEIEQEPLGEEFEKVLKNNLWQLYEQSNEDRVRELSDEEITKLWAESHEDGIAMQQGFTTQQHYFAHLLLKKAKEK